MKNLTYSVTKAQLIWTWIYVFCLVSAMIAEYDYADFVQIVQLIIGITAPYLLIFYTIGWRNSRKQERNN